ncbi:DUF4296 domain-containing protein [Algoriphagus sp. CAU 1675]|uniref:DUF4296 domain-containing protein n=1 Tax=Algoriphagus sp. CAU 1675 TaxID=3032597 RepID=UPI0023DC2325|nr:DUF4296 domain-containing protein [Algoriphagus sp. CAU 1675]MDF2158624.1 DUF4296 domain-containing protein [Algoriphagus sp. CAU 1675]
MKRLLAICTIFLVLVACDQEKEPVGLLSEEQMVAVLIDIHFTEGVASALPISYDSSQVLYSLMEKDVFLNHGVEDSVFTESMRYYLQFPKTMDRIYARVIDSLVVRESSGDIEEKM